MRHVMVRYTVKPDRAAENAAYIAAVFGQLHQEQPAELRYAAYRLDDGVSFVHVVSMPDDGIDPLRELAAFQAFLAGIRDRCVEPPIAVRLTELGAYVGAGFTASAPSDRRAERSSTETAAPAM